MKENKTQGSWGDKRRDGRGSKAGFGGKASFGNKSHRDNSSRGGFSRGDRGGRPSFGSRDQVLHKATCAECNKTCEVPFRPTGEKPVYCNDCFKGASSNFVPREVSHKKENIPTRSPADDTHLDEIKMRVRNMESKLESLISKLEAVHTLVSDIQKPEILEVVADMIPAKVKSVAKNVTKAVKVEKKVIANKVAAKKTTKKVAAKKK